LEEGWPSVIETAERQFGHLNVMMANAGIGILCRTIDMSLAEKLCAGLSGCPGVIWIDGAGHASNLTHPEPVNRAIESFLASVPEHARIAGEPA